MIDKTLNKEQAEALFNSKAILINGKDVIEEKEAITILGQEAFNFAVEQTKGARNGYGIGHYTLMYMTERAFMLGVTYRNVEIIAQAETTAYT